MAAKLMLPLLTRVCSCCSTSTLLPVPEDSEVTLATEALVDEAVVVAVAAPVAQLAVIRNTTQRTIPTAIQSHRREQSTARLVPLVIQV